MKKSMLIIVTVLLSFCSINNTAYSFARSKPTFESELYKYLRPSEFIRLSFEEISALTGIKQNLKNRLSFQLLKRKIRHDLKKNPALKLSDYMQASQRRSTVMKILFWVILATLILLGVFALVFSGVGGRR